MGRLCNCTATGFTNRRHSYPAIRPINSLKWRFANAIKCKFPRCCNQRIDCRIHCHRTCQCRSAGGLFNPVMTQWLNTIPFPILEPADMKVAQCIKPFPHRLIGNSSIRGHTTAIFLFAIVMLAGTSRAGGHGTCGFQYTGKSASRIKVQKNGNAYGESGVLIDLGPENKMAGQYLCILTADHSL